MIVYDCEIKYAILAKDASKAQGIKYCKGWSDFKGMGISCICAYDYDSGRWRVFFDDNLNQFQKLIDISDFVIGFNSDHFDNRLCKAHGVTISEEKSYDIYMEIKKADGYAPNDRIKGYSLDDCVRANLGSEVVGKTEDGALAPVFYQRGQYGRLVDYCMNDVYLTRLLFEMAVERRLVSPVTRKTLSHIRIP